MSKPPDAAEAAFASGDADPFSLWEQAGAAAKTAAIRAPVSFVMARDHNTLTTLAEDRRSLYWASLS
jgi:ABC-type nitrate/sulfonate/bicarbonate transport system substrate-binding protein